MLVVSERVGIRDVQHAGMAGGRWKLLDQGNFKKKIKPLEKAALVFATHVENLSSQMSSAFTWDSVSENVYMNMRAPTAVHIR